jgi:two-component system heavy metal sensor histidine kinase CusS
MELVRHVLAKTSTTVDVEALAGRMDDALTGHESLSVRLSTPEGRKLFDTGSATFPAALLEVRTADDPNAMPDLTPWEQQGHEYRGFAAVVPTAAAAIPRVVVAIAVATDEHHKFMVVLNRNLWLAIAAGILSTAILGWVAARRGLAPVREMARVARRVTASRLAHRLPVDSLPVELHELAGAFNEMLSRLEDSFRRLSEFSSDLAHELRTPIGNMMTQTQVALSRSRTAEEYREVLYSNSEEFDRLARMIADMLFLAQADHGLIVPRSESVDLASEVRELFEFYDALAEDRGVELKLAGDGVVAGERLMIRRAVSNLLSNAINHTPKGGTIVVQIEPAGKDEIKLSVDNPGEGIAPEHLSRVFDRFYRVDSSRQRSTEGAGLGLAITKSIMAAHRGSVHVQSGGGRTRFEIQFPPPAAA